MDQGAPGLHARDDVLDIDVAIVGCGPVGALAANLIAASGLRTMIVDRETEPHPLPRAAFILTMR